MRSSLTIVSVFLFGILFHETTLAQVMPLVYDVENTGEDCPEPPLLPFSSLSDISELPNPFEWADGRGTIQHFSDWRCRRAEIFKELQYYEVGEKPEKPEDLTASFQNGTLTVNVTVNGETLTLTSAINLPDGDGPFPVVIGMGGTSMPDSLFNNRDIARMNFNFGQVMAHTQTRGNEPINDLYPELEYMGAYSAWPWGVSRLIDGLEIIAGDANIDTEHIAVSGCSFAGKMAIWSGAFDERIALTFGIESGGGGYTTWRYSEVLNQIESVETLGNTSSAWFISDMFQFASDVERLPTDHHELLAMVAPRALFVTGNPGWVWLADESGYVGSRAAEKVYDALGISDRFAYSQIGGHNHCAIPASQVPEITAFLDKFMLGIDSVDTQVDTSPYTTNLAPWMPWETPTLTEGESFFGTAALTEPENRSSGTDTTINFSWDALDNAQQYYFQLSEDPSFAAPDVSDSSSSTNYSVNGLIKEQRYYWRVQVKNASGIKGPWSQPYTFITTLQLPPKPELISATVYRPTRPSYVLFTWAASEETDSYFIEAATDSGFTNVIASYIAFDSSRTVNGFDEDNVYYWRVLGMNDAGNSPWSEVSNFYHLSPPTELELESNTSSEIILRWSDNSSVESGYIVERKHSSESSFSVIDSVDSDLEEFTDATINDNVESYAYRLKAYTATGESAYSNEATLAPTSIREEDGVPSEFALNQNYPNPFNPSTRISFSLPESGHVTLDVFNVTGQKVARLVNTYKSAGNYSVVFDARNLTSGMYLYRIEMGGNTLMKKMLLIK